MLSLVVHLSGSTIRRPLSAGTIVIGSGAHAQLTIDDPAIAPVHAALSIGDDGIFLVDLGSATGTRVNGVAIRRAQLRENDEIVLGSTRLTIEPPAPVVVPSPAAVTIAAGRAKPTFLEPTRGGRAVEVAQLWGDSLVGLKHFHAGESVILGESPRCSFFAPGGDHVLVRHHHGEPVVRIPRGANGSVERNGDRLPLAAWLARGASDHLQDVAEIPLAPGERIMLEAAPGLTLLLQRVDRSAPVSGKSLDSDDRRFLAIFASLAFGFATIGTFLKLLALLGAFARPVPAGDTLARVGDIPLLFEIPAPITTPPLPKIAKAEPDAGDPDTGRGAKMTGDPGKIGRRDAKHERTRGSAIKNVTDRQIVEDSGVFKAMREIGADVPAIFGGGPLAAGLADNLGDFVGPEHVDARGPGGFALAGDDGKGGGGSSLTVAGFNPKGGRVQGGYDGFGRKKGKKGSKSDSIIGIDEGPTVVTVGLDPALIQAVIERHLAQLQTCYESRLTAVPTLGGKVVMKFTIAGDGFVSAAAIDGSSTLIDDSVHGCLVTRFKAMRFPAPPGKGTVGVKYPFLFKTAGN